VKVVQDVVAKILATIGYVHYYYRGTGEGGIPGYPPHFQYEIKP